MKASNARWYDDDKDNVHETLASVFRTVHQECAWRVDADEYHAGLYSASDAPGVRGRSRRGYEYGPATLPYNVSRSATDTLTSKVAQHRPLPQVLTQRGNWKNQKRAKKQTQFLEGEFYRQRVFERHWPKFIRDALVFGRGLVKIWAHGERICTERAFPWEVFADEWDARYGDPRNLYHLRSADRNVVKAMFARTDEGGLRKKLAEAIDNAGMFISIDRHDDLSQMTVDRVDVLEAWHLPSVPGAKDGRHVVIVQGATLVDEPWTLDYFPFVVLNYQEPLSGYWGHGLVEQIEGYQYELSASAEKLSEQYAMSGVGVITTDGGGIHTSELRNGITIMQRKAGGQAPVTFQMDLVNEHLRQRPRELTQDALNDTGLSQMSVQSQKPAGVQAAVALQTLDDFETERFMVFGRAAETAVVEMARRYIDCAKQIAAEYGDLAVSVPMKGGLLDLNWNDVYVDGVEIRVFPTSLLPSQLPARLEKLKDLFNTGAIDRSVFLRHLEAPDLQAELDMETADKIVIDEMLEAMAEADEDQGEAAYLPPSAYQELAWAGKRAQQKLNSGLVNGMPEFNQDLLRRFLKDVSEELAKLAPPPPPPAPVPPPAAHPQAPMLPDLGIPGAPPGAPMAA